MYQIQEFKDRVAKNPNKRKITIIEQNSNEIIANIEPVAEEITEQGTPFNAELMNKFQESIIQSETDSGEALKKANEAIESVKNGQGTSVYVDGTFIANFDADKKTDNTDFEALKGRVKGLEDSSIMTKILYDTTTNTFII